MAGQFTKGEMCMAGIISMFMEHASNDDDKDHLSKSEVKQLLEKEFPHFASVSFLPFTFKLDVQPLPGHL